MKSQRPFAEVIASSLSTWQAQCWDPEDIPAYGSILTVHTQQRTIFGLVHNISMGSQDTHRTVFAYKKSEEELKRDHPHIFEFLQTTFSCLTLGYTEHERILYQLAPEPPKIHTFVTRTAPAQLSQFFAHEQYLHTLFSHAHQIFSLDDLLLALLKQLSDHTILTKDHLLRFIETFSLLTANDYRRLKLFLQRVQPILKIAPSQSSEYTL